MAAKRANTPKKTQEERAAAVASGARVGVLVLDGPNNQPVVLGFVNASLRCWFAIAVVLWSLEPIRNPDTSL